MLVHNRYGKSEVRVVKVVRGAERHELRDLTVDVSLEGDNAGLPATDTMRNTVYAFAKDDRIDHLEKSEIRLTAYQRYRELFPSVLSAALGALVAAGLLFVGGLRVAPA